MPLTTSILNWDLQVESYTPALGAPPAHAEIRTASPEYFDAAGIPLIRGRGFAATDAPGAGYVAVVNQTFAAMYFPHQDPIGEQVRFTGPLVKLSPYYADWHRIVGVVGDTRDGGLDAAPHAVMFVAWAQEPAFFGGLVVRADSNVAALIGPVTRIIRRVAPDAPIEKIATVTQLKDESIAPRRLNAELISSFSLLALIIAAVGIAGVLAFSVSTRTNEIGIRMSLGADGGMVQRMVLGEGGQLLVLGLLLGIAGAYFTSGLIRGLLFGIPPRDPTTFLGVAGMMGAIGLVACWIPALRAARIDPAIAMRAS
jgi:putative ABC transport system permease protein